MTSHATTPDRLLDLLADRALQGLPDEESRELDSLLTGTPIDASEFDRIVASIDLALAGPTEEIPAALRDRVEADAMTWLTAGRGMRIAGTEDAPDDSAHPPSRRAHATPLPKPVIPADMMTRRSWLPWSLAAACLVVAVASWMTRPPLPAAPAPPPRDDAIAAAPDAARLYETLETQPDSVKVAWSDALEQGVQGDIVWNNTTQQGAMRFRGLARNDPESLVYQLWIFDGQRTKPYDAVDGGVFNVVRDGKDVYITVDAKLDVFEPQLFAVTTEPPGGVVKHVTRDEYKIILTGAPPEA